MDDEDVKIGEVILSYQKWFDFLDSLPTDPYDKSKPTSDFYENNFKKFAYLFFAKSD